MSDAYHIPVLADETMYALRIKPGGIYVDATLGGGGHSELILRELNGTGKLIGIDRDGDAIDATSARLKAHRNVSLMRGNFHDIEAILSELGINKVDGILADLGVSSHQLDTPERGFSYHADALLDMRMNTASGRTAANLVNTLSEGELTRVFLEYGEERWSARVAKFILQERGTHPIQTTGELVSLIDRAIPKAVRAKDSAHPARRIFQALRIAVNDELAPLESTLETFVARLKPGGRLAVITFHSLEDRIVKNAFARFRKPCVCPPSFPVCVCGRKPTIADTFKSAIPPSPGEVSRNPRSASAKLRVAEKL